MGLYLLILKTSAYTDLTIQKNRNSPAASHLVSVKKNIIEILGKDGYSSGG
jgi:hypothetical protein